MDEINYFNDFYSDMFSLNFDNLFSTVDLESLEIKENDTVVEVDNTLNQPSERAVLTETNMETNNLPGPEESGFLLSSNEQIQETLKQAENKYTNRSTAMWMKVWSSWGKSRNIDVNMETKAPATLDEVLKKFYVEVRKQDGSKYKQDSLKVMQAALERYLSTRKYPYSIITSREFASSRVFLDVKAKQLRMNGYRKRQNRAHPYNSTEEESFWSSGLLGDHSGVALTNANFKTCQSTSGFDATKTTTMLMYRTLKLRVSRSRGKEWQNTYGSTRTQRRPVLVA